MCSRFCSRGAKRLVSKVPALAATDFAADIVRGIVEHFAL